MNAIGCCGGWVMKQKRVLVFYKNLYISADSLLFAWYYHFLPTVLFSSSFINNE